jgi:flap endonuclease-1
MGVQLAELFPGRPTTFKELSGRRIAIDAHNALYQFLAIIRQPDGEPLRDSKGRVTSVYSGLFYRTSRMMTEGIEPVYVFDGPPPSFKKLVVKARIETRERARVRWEEALQEGDLKKAKKYAQSALRLTREIIENCKTLLTYMGVPYVVAPSEGEAQAAVMASRGDVWAATSQDFDALLFGSPRLVRNLAITGRRKLPNKDVYVEISPMVIELPEILSSLEITQEELVTLGLLVGTDYNQGGIPGIGPKKGLAAVKRREGLDKVMERAGWHFDIDYGQIHDFFLNPLFSEDYDLEFKPPDATGVKGLLCGEFDFSEARVQRSLSQMKRAPRGKQTELLGWA